MAETLTARLLEEHLIGGRFEPGQEIALRVDQALPQDATGTMACLQYLELGDGPVRVPLAVQYVDHNLLQLDFKNPDDHRFLRSFAARHGLYYSRPGNGICHYLHVERFARPGELLIGADSHTTTSGAVGMIAIGAGGLDVAVAMAGHPFEIETPRVAGVKLTGELRPWVQAKDVILELLRRRGVRGGVGKIFEFHGPGVATLSVAQRSAICNMIAELGATAGVFPSDARTREWLRQQKREPQWRELAADPGARYDEDELIALDDLEPLVARPRSPGNVVPVREAAGLRVAQVCVGSSVNSGYEDLALVAAVLRGHTLPEGVVLTVTPGSRQILHVIDLIAQGIVPLSFADERDLGRARVGDQWSLPDVRGALARGDRTLTARAGEGGRELRLTADFSGREREVLLAGGLLARLRAGGARSRA
jgi:aconitate hydratase